MAERDRPLRRPTIADVARRVGVSVAAVSYAMNDQPGVAESTRRRIRAVAEEMGWVPRPAARAVRGRGAGAVGFAMARPGRLFGFEQFHLMLAAGMAAELFANSYQLFLREVADVGAEAALYRRWHAEARVDAVFVANLRDDDPRVEVLNEIGLPAVVYGGPNGIGDLVGVWDDQLPALKDTVGYLAGLGHGSLAYVTGPPDLRHVAARVEAFLGACRRHAVERPVAVPGHYRGSDAARITERLLGGPARPTAVIYDNDVMALAGLSAARRLGLEVPTDLSIVSWEDSILVRHTYPPMATISRRVASRGERAAQALLALLAGNPMAGGPLEQVRLQPAGSISRLGTITSHSSATGNAEAP